MQRRLSWFVGSLFMDVPTLAANYLYHTTVASGEAWDLPSQAMLGLSALSLSVNLLWHMVRLCSIRPEDDEVRPDLISAQSSPGGQRTLRSQRTLRRMDSARYVGLSNQPIIGAVAGAAMYEA